MRVDQFRALFEPRGIVVAGASSHPGKFGFVALHNILSQGYAGGVFWERNTLNAQPKASAPVEDEHPMLLESPVPYRVTKSKTK